MKVRTYKVKHRLGRARKACPYSPRYMHLKIFLLFCLQVPSLASSQEMTANQAMQYWSDRFRNAIPNYSHDYEIDAWASQNGIQFEFVQPSDDELVQGKYLYKARLGKYRAENSDWECNYHFIVFKIWLDEFKQSGSHGLQRESACNHGRI